MMHQRVPSPDWNGPLWRYALDLYERAGVAPAFLTLQDRYGVDVCVLLAMLFGGERTGCVIDAAAVKAADDEVCRWRSNVVAPLRRVRRSVRGNQAMLYDTVKRSELLAEQLQLALLEAWLQGRPALPVARLPREIMREVVNFYSPDGGDAAADQAIDAIVGGMT